MADSRFKASPEFLQKIAQLETSGGTDINHAPVTHGLQAGTTAIGRYGVMPNTVKQLINIHRNRGTITPEMQQMDEMSPDKLKSYVEGRPEVEEALAKEYANKILQSPSVMGNEDKAAYAWQFGPNRQISSDDLDQSPRIQKFRKLNELMKPKVQDDEEDENGDE